MKGLRKGNIEWMEQGSVINGRKKVMNAKRKEIEEWTKRFKGSN